VEAFQVGLGKTPYQDWLQSLDKKTRMRIVDRVGRLEKGHFGDYKKIDQSLYELRFFFGPGYRVYFGDYRGTLILLLMGGDKKSQARDIRTAQQYWKIFQEDNS
jgi:putative addiction module killer protein